MGLNHGQESSYRNVLPHLFISLQTESSAIKGKNWKPGEKTLQVPSYSAQLSISTVSSHQYVEMIISGQEQVQRTPPLS